MPTQTRSLSIRAARSLVAEWAFPAITGDRVGLELEWLTRSPGAPVKLSELRRLLSAVEPLPWHSVITYEPGGQVELSTPPLGSCSDAIRAAATDSDVVRSALAASSIQTVGVGLDPDRSEDLVTDQERYVAMRAFFDARGPAGGRMMCTTAALHVNVDAGSDDEGTRRWQLAHRLGPTLVAAFSNSPLLYGRPSGWKSARFSAWIDIDPTRTAPAATARAGTASWVGYALAANVMFIRTPDGFVPMSDDISFDQWVTEGHPLGFPSADDLAYHLTTLFPPVRPQGRLELRMFDMLPDPWWRAAACVTTALMHDADAGAAAWEATVGVDDLWVEAARYALDHPLLAASARSVFAAALDALGRIECDDESARATAAYFDRFVARGRSPADERLSDYAATGELYPTDQTVEAT